MGNINNFCRCKIFFESTKICRVSLPPVVLPKTSWCNFIVTTMGVEDNSQIMLVLFNGVLCDVADVFCFASLKNNANCL